MSTRSPGRMTVSEFVAWTDAQHDGRYELLDGELFAMAHEHH